MAELSYIPFAKCALCGNGLIRGEANGSIWAYCPIGATGPLDAHTAYVIGELPRTRKQIKEEITDG